MDLGFFQFIVCVERFLIALENLLVLLFKTLNILEEVLVQFQAGLLNKNAEQLLEVKVEFCLKSWAAK